MSIKEQVAITVCILRMCPSMARSTKFVMWCISPEISKFMLSDDSLKFINDVTIAAMGEEK